MKRDGLWSLLTYVVYRLFSNRSWIFLHKWLLSSISQIGHTMRILRSINWHINRRGERFDILSTIEMYCTWSDFISFYYCSDMTSLIDSSFSQSDRLANGGHPRKHYVKRSFFDEGQQILIAFHSWQ